MYFRGPYTIKRGAVMKENIMYEVSHTFNSIRRAKTFDQYGLIIFH